MIKDFGLTKSSFTIKLRKHYEYNTNCCEYSKKDSPCITGCDGSRLLDLMMVVYKLFK